MCKSKKKFFILFGLLFSLLIAAHFIRSSSRMSGKRITFRLERCNCARTIVHRATDFADEDDDDWAATTCSTAAYLRGSGQKVVGFSLYSRDNITSLEAEKKSFVTGLEENVAQFRRYYSSNGKWSIRLYHDYPENDPMHRLMCELACRYPFLDLCHAHHLPGTPARNAERFFPMIWRFFPTLDPQVDVFLSRDLDSRFTLRELSAVREFLASGQAVHAMRDHPRHDVPLLGASWGADLRRKNSRLKWKESWKEILKDPRCYASRENGYGADQDVIAEHVWNRWAKNAALQHDSFHCKDFPGSIGFPTQRRNESLNFVAAVAVGRANTFRNRVTCPEECRRNPNWLFC